jgi:hypothetical protein
MSTSSDAENLPIQKKELIDALDFEIKHRQSALSAHGISTWGTIVATVGLLWAASSEAVKTGHNWTNVLLVLIAGH